MEKKSDKILDCIYNIGILGGIAFGAVILVFLFFFILLFLFLLSDSGDDIGDISTVAVSPTGEYQAEAVNISYGATGGESAVFIEIADGESFPGVRDNNTEKSIKIKETRSGWGAQYQIEWISDNSFTVLSGSDLKDYYTVTLDGKSYTVEEGLSIDQSKTKIRDIRIYGDAIEIDATIFVKNTLSEKVSFIASSYYLTKEKYYRGSLKVILKDYVENEKSLVIGPNEEKSYDITLYGVKNSDEKFVDDSVDSVFLDITRIGE
ncbi:hypothetical protein D6853_03560 [Butyrivibrio sp. X503]|uniref:hypothetical protein n=1 Tax=Butyrivibrio sp. X503 TaxID=2364878 RepID=UPI000EA9DF73|nr:hypothetical protein [Butyrivibrio sp. X503]RKM57105.1 hypothetical protein D6853_03560 [Butyrivibrio sp. X503]